jgi:antitoxin HicB
MTSPSAYSVTIQQLFPEDGGGYLAVVPDLPGCMSDGETPQEAFTNAQDAIVSWIEEAHRLGLAVPEASRQRPDYREVG